MEPTDQIKCPACGKTGNWFAGPYGPFCSERCKLIDLGKWFNEEPRISESLEKGSIRPDQGAADELPE